MKELGRLEGQLAGLRQELAALAVKQNSVADQVGLLPQQLQAVRDDVSWDHPSLLLDSLSSETICPRSLPGAEGVLPWQPFSATSPRPWTWHRCWLLLMGALPVLLLRSWRVVHIVFLHVAQAGACWPCPCLRKACIPSLPLYPTQALPCSGRGSAMAGPTVPTSLLERDLFLVPRWSLSSLPGSVSSFSEVGEPALGSFSERRCKLSCRSWRERSSRTWPRCRASQQGRPWPPWG